MFRVALAASVCACIASATLAGDWPQFRGPDGTGVLPKIEHPLTWSATANLAWKTELLGSGWSSPVVIGERIFVTTADADAAAKPRNMKGGLMSPRSFGVPGAVPEEPYRFAVHCLSLRDGELIWSKTLAEAPPQIPIHPSNTYATETPAADAERVYVYFGAIGKLAAISHAGEVVWERDFPVHPMSAGFGTGSSLALHDGALYLQRDNEADSSIAAIEAKTGKTVWEQPRPCKTSWATPLVWTNAKRTELIACGAGNVWSYDPASGEELWTLGGITSSFSASPTASRDRLFFANSGPFTVNSAYAVVPGAGGDITPDAGGVAKSGLAWTFTRPGVGMSTPVTYDGLIYVPGEGRLIVYDAETGERVYRTRLKGGGTVVASGWAGDGRVFFLDEGGNAFVIKAGRTYDLEHVNTIEDVFWSTPAVAGRSLLLRGVNALYCIRETPKTAPAAP